MRLSGPSLPVPPGPPVAPLEAVARRVLRGLAVALVVVAGLCALVRVGVWAWFQSDAGQRYVLGRLRGALAPAGVELDVGHLGGSLATNLRLEDVTVRACAAGVRVRASRLTIRYPVTS